MDSQKSSLLSLYQITAYLSLLFSLLSSLSFLGICCCGSVCCNINSGLSLKHNHTLVLAVTILGSGGTNGQPLWDAWAYSYKFSQDTVDIQYTGTRTDVALDLYRKGEIDYCGLDIALPKEQKDMIQLPFVATATAFVYHLDGLDPANDSLVLDRPTLGRMYSGSIVTWDHPAIAALNPDLHKQGKLPHLNITYTFFPGVSYGQNQVVGTALSSFSDEFKAALEKGGDLFENLPPVLQGRAVPASSIAERSSFVKVRFTSHEFGATTA